MKTTRFNAKKEYPLASKRPDLIRTMSGKEYKTLTLENLISGNLNVQEIRISPETLELQAQIAQKHGRPQLALNFRRAAELTRIPDQEVLKIYNALRPGRSTKEELTRLAKELVEKYQAKLNAAFIREAAQIYEKRNLLKKG